MRAAVGSAPAASPIRRRALSRALASCPVDVSGRIRRHGVGESDRAVSPARYLARAGALVSRRHAQWRITTVGPRAPPVDARLSRDYDVRQLFRSERRPHWGAL